MESPEEADRLLDEPTRRNLRKEATSVSHLSTHRPENPYCASCNRAKMTCARHYKGAFVNEAERWGSHLTADFITSKNDALLGIKGKKHLFVIGDLYSGLWHAFPTETRTTAETVECFKMFVGQKHNEIFQMYSDSGKEIIKMLNEFHILARHGQPGISRANAVVERRNREVQMTARVLLDAAGLPSCFLDSCSSVRHTHGECGTIGVTRWFHSLRAVARGGVRGGDVPVWL